MQKRLAPRIRHHRVLVVEDEPSLREIIRLTLANFDCVLAGDGHEALEILGKDSKFDWIVTDIHMPRMSGFALYQAVTQVFPRMKKRFVFMTGSVLHESDRQVLHSLAWSNRIYAKPFSMADLAVDLAERPREPSAR